MSPSPSAHTQSLFAGQKKQYDATKLIENWPKPIKLKKKTEKKNSKKNLRLAKNSYVPLNLKAHTQKKNFFASLTAQNEATMPMKHWPKPIKSK